MASIIKSDNGVSSGITGIVQSADSSGQLVLQTTTSSGTATTAVTIDNTQVATFANTLKAPNLQGPAFSAYQSTLQAVSSSTNTKIQFQTKEFDTASAYDNSTNYRFTPQVAGYYQIDALVNVVTPTTFGGLTIYKNGSGFKAGVTTNSSQLSCSASCLIYMNGSTDYIEVYLYTNNATNTLTGATNTYFQASMVRSA